MAKQATSSAPAPAPRLTRAESKAQTRSRILAAATAVFEREGYHGASLERIAAEAGFTKGAVYSTFDSKADVMLALIGELTSRRQAELEDVFGPPPIPRTPSSSLRGATRGTPPQSATGGRQ